MNKFHSFATCWTNVFAIDILSPITNVSATVVVETRLAFQHLVFATIAKVICRTIVRIWIKSSLLVRTFYGAVDHSRLGRHECWRHGHIARQWRCGKSGRGRCCGAHGFGWPHAALVWL